ncbi:MAG: hypothetical protein OQK25_07400 [Gammaproteobacteria bacterium]|nr:hypothetical protein [Gammaproteobacteria bacterium]
MDLKLFLQTVMWLPVLLLIGYAAPQFMFGTNLFYGFIGMMFGIFIWVLILMVAISKRGDE